MRSENIVRYSYKLFSHKHDTKQEMMNKLTKPTPCRAKCNHTHTLLDSNLTLQNSLCEFYPDHIFEKMAILVYNTGLTTAQFYSRLRGIFGKI